MIPLEKLLVREDAGQDLRVIYLINQEYPEMLQLKVQKPKDKQIWIQAIRYLLEKIFRLHNFF